MLVLIQNHLLNCLPGTEIKEAKNMYKTELNKLMPVGSVHTNETIVELSQPCCILYD